jgi:hypothetical protein
MNREKRQSVYPLFAEVDVVRIEVLVIHDLIEMVAEAQ